MDVKVNNKMMQDLNIQHELLKTALESTDAYLGIEKQALAANKANSMMIHDFTYHMSRAHDALQSLGVLSDHQEYMANHVSTMSKLFGDDDNNLADLPYAHVPGADFSGVDEAFKMPAETAQEKMYRQHQELRKKRGLPDPEHYKKLAQQKQKEIEAMKEDSSVEESKEFYADAKKRAKADTPQEKLSSAWKAKAKARAAAAGREYPNLVDNVWAARKQESVVVSFVNFIAEEREEFSEEDITEMVDSLTWEDIVDLYPEEDLIEEETEQLDEKISAQSRLKRRQGFARGKTKRNTSKGIKLRRASTPAILQKRAQLAARRAIYQRLLRGRDKSALSASEKDRVEQQVKSMKNIQVSIATRMVPKMRSIEQKRLANYRGGSKK